MSICGKSLPKSFAPVGNYILLFGALYSLLFVSKQNRNGLSAVAIVAFETRLIVGLSPTRHDGKSLFNSEIQNSNYGKR